MYWKCSCGETFQETGDRSGFSSYSSHNWKHRKNEIEGDGKLEGLFDENDELLATTIKEAIRTGNVERANPKVKEGEKKELKAVFNAKAKIIEIELDPEILVLYYLTKGKFTTFNSSIGEWISDCIVDYYNEHRELGLDVLLSNRPEIMENYLAREE